MSSSEDESSSVESSSSSLSESESSSSSSSHTTSSSSSNEYVRVGTIRKRARLTTKPRSQQQKEDAEEEQLLKRIEQEEQEEGDNFIAEDDDSIISSEKSWSVSSPEDSGADDDRFDPDQSRNKLIQKNSRKIKNRKKARIMKDTKTDPVATHLLTLEVDMESLEQEQRTTRSRNIRARVVLPSTAARVVVNSPATPTLPNEWPEEPDLTPEQEALGIPSCVICLTKGQHVVFVPCGHQATCVFCTRKLEKKLCPICRAPFIAATRVFRNEPQAPVKRVDITPTPIVDSTTLQDKEIEQKRPRRSHRKR